MAAKTGELLRDKDIPVRVLDGDHIRRGLCSDLGYSEADRRENMRRVAEVCRLFVDSGVIVLAAFIAPSVEMRKMLKEIIGPDLFFVFCDCPPAECERRDPKGHYAKARRGEISSFTGVSAPYIPPVDPHLYLFTGRDDIEACLARVMAFIDRCRYESEKV